MTDHTKQLTNAAEQLKTAHAARDQAILDAHAAGMQSAAIAAAVELSRMQVHRIVKAAETTKYAPHPPEKGR